MKNRGARDDNAVEGSLAHNADWSDVWAGLLLTLFLLGSAILVATLFSGRPSSLSTENQRAAVHRNHLHGVRDPRRPGWRVTDRTWGLMGVHEMTADAEVRGRGQAMEDSGRGEETIESFIVEVSQARPR
jgi:hypothetical protein